MPLLARLLADQSTQVRRGACSALIATGDSGVYPDMVPALADPDLVVRDRALRDRAEVRQVEVQVGHGDCPRVHQVAPSIRREDAPRAFRQEQQVRRQAVTLQVVKDVEVRVGAAQARPPSVWRPYHSHGRLRRWFPDGCLVGDAQLPSIHCDMMGP